uniref:EF-hand domain-containing protein n=1 Tax=Pseudo-nitzschia delicatissima TaxID=44447 RepID=A0A7S0Y8D8_9STRA|mmetsp:Transcript_4106/g.8512  ORF Transcript_4106/g.8512 Transcript_4106/m.8512 type:complete len:218 (+) Transcript_4106:74-727(+)
MKSFVGILLTLLCASTPLAVASQQYYDDYGEDAGGDYYQQQDYGAPSGGDYGDEGGGDTLYEGYMKHQEDKAMGRGGLSPFVKNVAIGATSWFFGAKFHSRRAVKKSEKTSAMQQQRLYERYVKDVTNLQMQNTQLQEYIQATTIQQLADEFREADVNHDNKVSRLEFEQYKRKYLKLHPEADPSMFPRFEDFDPDHNGMVTFTEHENYYRNQGMIA